MNGMPFKRLFFLLLTCLLVGAIVWFIPNNTKSLIQQNPVHHIKTTGSTSYLRNQGSGDNQQFENRGHFHAIRKFEGNRVYAFFQNVEGSSISIDSNEMLRNWKDAWSSMGWEPRILTMEDAKNHPFYSSYEEMLNLVPLDDPIKPIERSRIQYLKYLAMASVGGGWLSEYDTMPLRSPLPIDKYVNKFSVYESPGISSLLSGSASEWTRMAKLLLKTGMRNKNSPHWSETMGLVHVIHTGECECDLKHMVLEADQVLTGRPLEAADCELLQNYMGVHFSALSLNRSHDNLEGRDWHQKPQIVKEWFKSFRIYCVI